MKFAEKYAAMRRDAIQAASCQQIRKGPKWGRVRPKVEEGKTVEQVKPLFSDELLRTMRAFKMEAIPERMCIDVRRWLVLSDAAIEPMRDLPGWIDVEEYKNKMITYQGEVGEYFGLAIIQKEGMGKGEGPQ